MPVPCASFAPCLGAGRMARRPSVAQGCPLLGRWPGGPARRMHWTLASIALGTRFATRNLLPYQEPTDRWPMHRIMAAGAGFKTLDVSMIAEVRRGEVPDRQLG